MKEVEKILAEAGYAFDPQQNIFYSVMNPWQKQFGYCRLYDEAAAAFCMIYDCEPVYFDYAGKRWLIELWKGQYGITTGAEIGIYNTSKPELNVPFVFNGTFYDAPGEEDYLDVQFALFKNGEKLFSRADKHWWLTGFVLGEYSKPSELTMICAITLKDTEMRDAFLEGLTQLGYTDDELRIDCNTVMIYFSKPHSRQPMSQFGLIAAISKIKNRHFVKEYDKITNDAESIYDILHVIREKSPMLYRMLFKMGGSEERYKPHEKIKDYI
ncbi:MAG: DUF4474 domain-containing protein [Intestinibacillus sp.]